MREKARDTKEGKVRLTDEGDGDVQNLGLVRLAEKKAEKKTRQRESRAHAKVEAVSEGKKVEIIIEDAEEVITINNINHLPDKTPQTARSIVWCPKVNRFVQKVKANQEPMRLEIKTLHGVEIKNDDGGIRKAKVPITKENMRKTV